MYLMVHHNNVIVIKIMCGQQVYHLVNRYIVINLLLQIVVL